MVWSPPHSAFEARQKGNEPGPFCRLGFEELHARGVDRAAAQPAPLNQVARWKVVGRLDDRFFGCNPKPTLVIIVPVCGHPGSEFAVVNVFFHELQSNFEERDCRIIRGMRQDR